MTDHDNPSTAADAISVITFGDLAGNDVAAAMPVHDEIATDSETSLRGAGNVSHLVALSTTLMGGTAGSLLSIDRWTSPDANVSTVPPALVEGAGIFTAPPLIERYRHRADWFSFGELPDGSVATDAWLIIVRGQLAGDAASAQADHDAAASAGAPTMRQAGDVAHLPFTGVDDPTQFISIDVWNTDDLIETMYGNPAVADGFTTLFVEPPTLTVYRMSDWRQW